MKKNVFYAALVFAAACVGCNNSGDSVKQANDSNETKMDSNSTANQPVPSSISETDSKFMTSAANAGMTEVTLGNYAANNSTNEKVKTFGNMMVTDHSKAGDELKKIAATKNVTLPDSLSEESKKHTDDLMKKKGKEFDKAYINMMVDGHEKVLKDFEDEQQNGSDPELKNFVTQTIPVIKQHLESAKSIKASMK